MIYQNSIYIFIYIYIMTTYQIITRTHFGPKHIHICDHLVFHDHNKRVCMNLCVRVVVVCL